MLRELLLKDAPLMLEWMHDEGVIQGLQPELFRRKTLKDCSEFILSSKDDKKSCHMAIVDDNDEYLGTVSLKMIDLNYGDAEFAIVLRTSAQGKGYATMAMKDIMEVASDKYKLKEVYWNVLRKNESAIKLYKNCGYSEMDCISDRRRARAPKKKNGEMEDVIFFHAIL